MNITFYLLIKLPQMLVSLRIYIINRRVDASRDNVICCSWLYDMLYKYSLVLFIYRTYRKSLKISVTGWYSGDVFFYFYQYYIFNCFVNICRSFHLKSSSSIFYIILAKQMYFFLNCIGILQFLLYGETVWSLVGHY